MWVASTINSTNAWPPSPAASFHVAALSIHMSGVSSERRASVPRIDRDLERLHCIVSAVGVTRIVGLAEAGDGVFQTALMSHDRRQGEEDEVTAGHEGARKPVRPLRERQIRREGARAHLLENSQVDDVVTAEPRSPFRIDAGDARADQLAAIHLDRVPLAVREADGLDMLVAGQRPGQAGRGILTARKEDDCRLGHLDLQLQTRVQRSVPSYSAQQSPVS